MHSVQLEIEIGKKELKALRKAAGEGPVLISTRYNPDPDGLVAGHALAELLHHTWGLPSQCIYFGAVDRAIDRSLLHLLTPRWQPGSRSLQLDRYSAIALVDTQPGAPDNYLFSSDIPHIVLDHHQPIDHGQVEVRYVDIRPSIGTTSTLVFQYLKTVNADLNASLSTALFFAIKVATCGLSRGASSNDVAAYLDLLPRIEPKILSRVECAALPKADYPAFVRSLATARVYDRAMVANLGHIHRPGFLAELSDFLIRMERIQGVFCTGCYQGWLYIATRITKHKLEANSLLQNIVNETGQAGGDNKFAWGQIRIGNNIAQRASVEGQVTKSFLHLMGEDGEGPSLLQL
jgi:nanoRNase/pAp phosphatase (c-di-AMP/oligoRNAs hydrolase)